MEPITVDPARPVRALLTMDLLDVAFLHWPAGPHLVASLLPGGTRPDVFGGASYVGLVALRMSRVGFPGLPGLPYLGTFPQINLRLYTVGRDGRRGVVFRSLDAARLVPVLAGRSVLRLPYHWASLRVHRDGEVMTYQSRRRWPGPGDAFLRLALRIGEPLAEPSELERFLTARWGLHTAWFGRRASYLPNEHPRWPLHRAELIQLTENLTRRAGLPVPGTGPVSVLYSPGVRMRTGPARRPVP